MKDLVGNELGIGDVVVFATSSYSTIELGRINKLTPKGVKVQPLKPSKYRQPETFRPGDRVYKTNTINP